jgi:hypothetical protein
MDDIQSRFNGFELGLHKPDEVSRRREAIARRYLAAIVSDG